MLFLKMMLRLIILLSFFFALPTALAELSSNKETPPGNAKLLAAQANKDYLQGALPSAEKKYEQALLINPNNIDYLNHLAAIETRLGKPQEAEQHLRQSIQQQLENPTAWLLLGMNALEEQKNDAAFADLMQATLYDPNNARAHNYLGIAAGHKGWNEISEFSLRRAIELDPNYADAHFNLAVYYLRRTPPAIELGRRHYQRALDLGAPRDSHIDQLIKNFDSKK